MLESELYKLLKDHQINYQVVEHQAIQTIAEMLQQGIPHQQWIAKNLFLRDDKKRNYYLLVVEQNKTIQMQDLQNQLASRRLSFASSKDLSHYLKVPQGSVTPLAVLNDESHCIKVIIDKDLSPTLGIHPLTNTKTIFLKKKDLIKLLKDCLYDVQEIKI